MTAKERVEAMRQGKPVLYMVTEQADGCVGICHSDIPTHPSADLIKFFESSPALPPLPDSLERFAFLYRMAIRKRMPADKAAEVIEAVEEAADVASGKLKGKVWQSQFTDRVEELSVLDEWFEGYSESAEAFNGTDPFAGEELDAAG